MSNQPQQQQNQKPQTNRHWRFLLQSGDQDFATRARAHVQRKYGAVKVTTDLGTLSLHEDSTIVVLFKDPRREIREANGTTRPRRRTTGHGRQREPGDKCEVLESPPVKCEGFYRDADDNQGAVNLMGESGLIAALHNACKSDQKRAAPVRVQYDDRNRTLQVRSV